MQVRIFNKTDYPMLCDWWKGHGWTSPAANMLPKTGFVVDDICAGFLYNTDSDVGIFEFIISNPSSSKEDRDKGLDLLIETANTYADAVGFKAVFTFTSHPNLIERLKDKNFKVTDETMTHLVRRF